MLLHLLFLSPPPCWMLLSDWSSLFLSPPYWMLLSDWFILFLSPPPCWMLLSVWFFLHFTCPLRFWMKASSPTKLVELSSSMVMFFSSLSVLWTENSKLFGTVFKMDVNLSIRSFNCWQAMPRCKGQGQGLSQEIFCSHSRSVYKSSKMNKSV